MLDLQDFYFTGDNYRYRFEPEAKKRFLVLLRGRFNSGVRYRGRAFKWDTVIEQKADELGRFLVAKSSAPEFTEPSPRLERLDGGETRARILALTSSHAKRLGIAESTLHYLRKHAQDPRSFRTYHKIRQKIEVTGLNRNQSPQRA